MRYLIYLILLSLYSYSASLTLNEAKDKNKIFSILHIEDKKPFRCEVKILKDFKNSIICTFSTNTGKNISKKGRYLDVNVAGNRVVITIKNRFLLQSLQDDFITSNTIKHDLKGSHKHWIVYGFKDDIEFLKSRSNSGIDFDILFQDTPLPYVGSLDLNGLPIVQKSDASSLNRIKEQFELKKYSNVLKLTKTLIDNKNSKFLQEAKLYRLRALDALAWEDEDRVVVDTDELLNLAKEWMIENPSSKHLPEVLMYLSKAYYKLGYVSKGNEYFNILKEEFYDSKFTKIAQIQKANRLYQNRKRRPEAMDIYKDVLYNTKNITIASNVASIISRKYMDMQRVDLAYKFYKKIVDANRDYILSEEDESYSFAKEFMEHKKYDLALSIVETLLLKKESKFRDDLSKDLAYLRELSGDKELAYQLYKNYLKEFPNGEHVDFVNSRLDKVLFDIDEKNSTKKRENIEKILKSYPDDPIYKKALIQKAQILISEKNFDELFAIEDKLKSVGAERFLKYGAKSKIGEDLKKDNCKDAIYLAQEYNATVNRDDELKYFECLMRFAKYKEALNLTKKYKDAEPLEVRADWLYRKLLVHSKLDHNKKSLLIAQDLEKLAEILKTDKYDDILYIKAKSYYNLGEYPDLMLKEIDKAQDKFPNDIRNIDLFMKALRYAKKRRDDMLIVNYSKKIISLQKIHKIDDYSPLVEIDYINALKHLKQYDKALKEVLKLLYVKLSDTQRANVLFIAGELSLKIGKTKEAKEFFIKCGNIVEDSSWQRLCAESLKLLDE